MPRGLVIVVVVARIASCQRALAPPPVAHVAPPAAPAAPAPAVAPGMITDDDCRARGGEIVTEQTYAYLSRRPRDPAHPPTPFKVCRFPSPANGHTCRSDHDCGNGRCMCTGALARPDPENDPALVKLDGTPATGTCSDSPMPSGSWFCMVEGGTVHLAGIIID